jgi:hypothetical protein
MILSMTETIAAGLIVTTFPASPHMVRAVFP